MPSYVQIEFAVPRTGCEAALGAFESVLRDLGAREADARRWLESVAEAVRAHEAWPPGAPTLGCRLAGSKRDISCRPLILDFRSPSDEWPDGQVTFQLLVESESVCDAEGRYQEWAGAAFLRTMLVVHRAFPAHVLFVTDEVTDGVPFEALPSGTSEIWRFDLALVPQSALDRFEEAPNGYERHAGGGIIWFGRDWAWPRLPWAD